MQIQRLSSARVCHHSTQKRKNHEKRFPICNPKTFFWSQNGNCRNTGRQTEKPDGRLWAKLKKHTQKLKKNQVWDYDLPLFAARHLHIWNYHILLRGPPRPFSKRCREYVRKRAVVLLDGLPRGTSQGRRGRRATSLRVRQPNSTLRGRASCAYRVPHLRYFVFCGGASFTLASRWKPGGCIPSIPAHSSSIPQKSGTPRAVECGLWADHRRVWRNSLQE